MTKQKKPQPVGQAVRLSLKNYEALKRRAEAEGRNATAQLNWDLSKLYNSRDGEDKLLPLPLQIGEQLNLFNDPYGFRAVGVSYSQDSATGKNVIIEG